MAQARVKATGEVIEVIPKGKDGVLHMYDVVGKEYYTWSQLEPVKIKSGLEPTSVTATEIKVSPSVNFKMVVHQKNSENPSS